MDTQMRSFYMLPRLLKLAEVSGFDTGRRRSRGRTRRMESSSRVLHDLTKSTNSSLMCLGALATSARSFP